MFLIHLYLLAGQLQIKDILDTGFLCPNTSKIVYLSLLRSELLPHHNPQCYIIELTALINKLFGEGTF